MKSLVMFLAVLFFVVFFVSCGDSKSENKNDENNQSDSDSVATDDDSVQADDDTILTDDDTASGKFIVAGFVQKGPFVQGSDITIAEIDNELTPIGTSYTTATEDDFGSFQMQKEMSTNFVEVTASGYYFNEVEGKLSTSALSFRVVSDLTEEKPVNINILTTIERERIKVLIGEGKTFEEARVQAETEILAVFNIHDIETTNFQEMDISKEGDSNAILLAISAVLQQGNTEAELSELISKIYQDIKLDGKLDASGQIEEIKENGIALDLAAVRTNLEARYEDLGLTLTIPKFEDFVDSDGDGLINRYDLNRDFEAVAEADLDKDYISNEITVVLPPFYAEAPVTTDKGILVINSEEKSASENVMSGDKVAIKLKASQTHGVTEKASFRIECDPSYEITCGFSVTTKEDKYFSLVFTAVTDAEINKDYTSNEQTVVLPETIADADAVLENGTLLINGADKGKSATVVNGDKVSIRLSTAEYDADVKGILEIEYLGNVVSGEFIINAPRMICNTETCEDLVTGLIWKKDYEGSFDQNGWFDARDFCLQLDYAGKTDWRLPKVWEFRTIVSGCPGTVMENGLCGVTESCLSSNCSTIGNCSCAGGNTFFNEDTMIWEAGYPMQGGFWTGSTVSDDTSKAWVAFPGDGPKIQTATKTDDYTHARCVRSDSDVNEEYTEIYKDAATNLEWTKKSYVNGDPETYCADLTIDSKSDWRLPTITELRTIIDGCEKLETGGACQTFHDCAVAGTCMPDINCFCSETLESGSCFYDLDNFDFQLVANHETPSSTIYDSSVRFTIGLCDEGRLKAGSINGIWSIKCVRP